MDELWINKEADFLSRRSHSGQIAEIAVKYSFPEHKIKRILKRFWQRGMTKNSLIPDHYKCGARGKTRSCTEKKRGRPRSYTVTDAPFEGINIDENVKDLFRRAIKDHYRTIKKPYLTETLEYLLDEYFSDHYNNENGKRRVVRWDTNRCPTYHQFYYWFKNEEEEDKDHISRYGENDFALKKRALLSNSTLEANGPGSIYQIDATIADTYLVSSLSRVRIIGRPIVYFVKDVFSRMIAGMYVGLEGPSWLDAMMALDNVITNKVSFCKEYGIEIGDEEWPCNDLPELILADNGEFEGYDSEKLINNLNIIVENTAPNRGDSKGIVERQFRTMNEKIKHTMPGAIEKEYRRRHGKDPRLEACLNIKEFTAVLINEVLWHNKHILDGYPPESDMLGQVTLARPIDLWNWGIKNKKGRFISFPQDIVRLNLMHKAKASISRMGIRFEGRYYTCDTALREGWYVNGKLRSLEIAFDPRNLNCIFIPGERGLTFEKAYLLEKSETYKDLIWEESRFHRELIIEQQKKHEDEEKQASADRNTVTNEIIENARKATKKQREKAPKQPKSKQIRDIKPNRLEERDILRTQESFDLGSEQVKNGIVIPIISKHQEGSDSVPDIDSVMTRRLEKVKKLRDEKLGKK